VPLPVLMLHPDWLEQDRLLQSAWPPQPVKSPQLQPQKLQWEVSR
jgi:hypothetical protein